jgi:hypothetical protein
VAIEHEGSGVKLSAILGPLLDAKADHELLRAMVLAHEAAQADALEKRRESDRLRQAAKAERDRLSRESREPHDGVSSHVRVEDSSSKKDNNKEEKKERAPAAPSPRDELEKVLDPEHAAAVIDHRQRLRKPLSPHAAKLLAAKFAAFPDANAAADRMIEAGWSKIEPHWGQDRPNSTAPPKKKTIGDIFRDDAKRMGLIPNDNPPDTTPERLAISDGSRESGGTGIARRFALPSDILGELGPGSVLHRP